MSRITRKRLAALVPLLLVAACGGSSSSSDSGSDGGGGNGGSGVVEFAISGQFIFEEDIPVEVVVTLSSTVTQDVFVHFTTTGNAQSTTDYFLVTQSPLVIPELATQATIHLAVIEDLKGEPDEVVRFEIISVVGGQIGNQNVHTVTIDDDDQSLFQETEPNDDIANANGVGTLGKATSYLITGQVGGVDVADVFELGVPADLDVQLTLDPVSGVALQTLRVTDQNDQDVVGPFVAGEPGESISASFSLTGVSPVYFHVLTDATTSYFLEMFGIEFAVEAGPPPIDPGPGGR